MTPRPARTSLTYQLVRGLIVGAVSLAAVCYLFPHNPLASKKKPDDVSPPSGRPPHPAPGPAPAPPSGSPAPDPTPAPPPAGPAELPLADDTSPDRIARIASPAEAASVHRLLSLALLARLEQLASTHDRDRIRIAVQELAERFYLLDRLVKLRGLEPPGPASLSAEELPRVGSLLTLWQENLDLSLSVDLLFRQRGLLIDEHVPQMLRRWAEATSEQ